MRSDEQLAREAQQNNPSAAQELVERHHAPLFGFLYRLTAGDRELAADLTQEAFLHALRALRSYAYPRPFKAWLYAIAVNCARDHYKRAEIRRTSLLSGDEWENGSPPVSVSLEEAAQARGDLQGLSAALQELPLSQREILLLRYSQDLSLAEIAETLCIPLGTVKSRLRMGLEKLKMMMLDQG